MNFMVIDVLLDNILYVAIGLAILLILIVTIVASKKGDGNKNTGKKSSSNKGAKPKGKASSKTNTSGDTKYSGKFEVFPEGEYFRYRLKASNGEVLVVSEMYASLEGAKSAIDTVIKNTETGTFTVYDDKKKMHKFKLTSGNNRILVISANYTTASGAQRAIESFKKFASTATIDVLKDGLKDERGTGLDLIELGKVKSETGGKYEITKEKSGAFSWALRAANAEIMAQGDEYTTKDGCLNAIEIFKSAVKDGQFYTSKDKKGLVEYRLYSSTGRLVLTGESYGSKQAAESAANTVKTLYAKAVLEEGK